MTELSLDISQNSNTKIIRLFDASHYHSDELVDNYLIEILPVNKSKWITFHVKKEFSLVLNSSNLLYKSAKDTNGLISLPDGIYEIKQSTKPNIFTVKHFYYLRTTELANKIAVEREKLYDNKCNLSKTEFLQAKDELRDIEEYLIAAKWKVEECLDKIKGKEMYEFANKKLTQYNNACKC